MRAHLIPTPAIIAAAVAMGGSPALALIPTVVTPSGATVDVTATQLDSADFVFTGTADDAGTAVLAFTATSLSFDGYAEAGPCQSTSGVGVEVDRAGSGAVTFSGTTQLPVVVHVTNLTYDGLQSAWTPAAPPAPGAAVPASVTGFSMTATTVAASGMASALHTVARVC